MKRALISYLFLLIFCMVAHSTQNHHFYTHFTNADGISTSMIPCCSQDDFDRIWIGTRSGVYYYTGTIFMPLLNQDYLDNCSQNTLALKEDNDKCMWISTSQGIGYYDTFIDKFTIIKELEDYTVNDIDIMDDGTVWLTSSSGIWKYSKDDSTLTKVLESDSLEPFRSCVVENNNLAFTAQNGAVYLLDSFSGNLWAVKSQTESAEFRHIEYVGKNRVLISDGRRRACTMDISTGQVSTIVDSDILENKAEIFCLLLKDGLYWIGTAYGLIIYDPETGEMEIQFPDDLDSSKLGGESVRCLFEDTDGNVWAGTYNGGLRCWMSYEEGFSRFCQDESQNSLIGNSIRSVCEGPDGMIWLGSEEGYLSRFNPETKTSTDFTHESGISYGTSITQMITVDKKLWIATYGEGVLVFDPARGKAVKKYNLPANDCLCIIQTPDKNIFVGTSAGLLKYDSHTDSFAREEIVGRMFIHSLMTDRFQNLLLGVFSQGICSYDYKSGSFKKAYALQGRQVTHMLITSDGSLWAATDGSGLWHVEYSSDGKVLSETALDKTSGMPSNTCCSLAEDDNGMLWVSTYSGLVEVDMEHERVNKVFMEKDNVLGCRFCFCHSYKSDTGQIYFGSNNGLLIFEPEYLTRTFGNSKIYFTDVALGTMDGRTSISEKGKSAITSNSLRINQKDAAYLDISFSSMVYGTPNIETYDCYLTAYGFNSHLTTADNHIAYTSLRPSKYNLTVNYEGSNDPKTEASIQITIKAPWYRSRLAFLLYLLILGGIFSFWKKNHNRKKEQEEESRLELMNAKKEKDLAHEKMEFFTNIAHEIRTPVSVLQILLDKIISEKKMPQESSGDINSMKLNVDRLKKLCNDILDFRKMESGETRLVFTKEDIGAICSKAISSFESAASIHEVTLTYDNPESLIQATCDADAVESVICNLLSNAIKYCKSAIYMSLTKEDDQIVIKVENDGERIPDEESEMIFKAFYQSKTTEKNGTGLGLTYSRQIAEHHNGRLYLDTSVKDKNVFVFELPATQEVPSDYSADDSVESAMEEDEILKSANSGNKAVVLVVEDNDSMRNLIKEELEKTYDVLVARDGEEALTIVKEKGVDLVVSDIMMPKMDGCELCNAIKENIHLSHIPVLLLTAAVGIDTHIRSLKSGADGYIEKPFKMDILMANITNLFRNRDIRNEQFSSSPLSHFSFSSVSKVEQEFMNRLHTFIIDHISDTDLTIARLSEALAVSKPTLTRKVKANTGQTVNEYVRICRLKKATELLAENNYRINEVAYLVGYSSPSYFTRNFQKQFGCLPSEFVKREK